MNRMDGRDTCIYTSETSNLLDIIVIIPGQQKKGVKTAVIIEISLYLRSQMEARSLSW